MSNVNRIKVLRRKINNLEKTKSRHQSWLSNKISRMQRLISRTKNQGLKQQLISRLNFLQTHETGVLNLFVSRLNAEILVLQNELSLLEGDD